MLKIGFLSLSLFLIIGAQLTACDRNDRHQKRHLVLHHRLYSQFLDKLKLQSYLSSFGEGVSASEQHKIYKRAPARIKKVKLNENKSKLASTENIQPKNPKNVTITPRHMIKFEIEDAKYNEEYEQMKKSRKLRVRRSTNSSSSSSLFREPKEIFKFSISDAVTKAALENPETKKPKKDSKTKREIKSESYDSETDSSKSIKITHPLSSTRKNRYVTFDDLPSKLQKSIESAVNDVQKKVPDGDYLKFYYGDRIIKIPQSMWKYIASKSKASTESKQPVKFPSEQEEKKNDYSEMYGQKTFYSTTTYKPPTTIVEKAKSYVNFDTPKETLVYKKLEEEEEEAVHEVYEPKKSFYFYAPPPSPPPTKSTPSLSAYANKIPLRETIPIVEDSFEEHQHHGYVPIYQQTIEHKPTTVKSLPIPTPTSFVEFNDHKYSNTHDNEPKNYEFGYQVTDYKSGNNFGHTQSKKQNVINGQYSILLPDGRVQVTKYFADDSGFHADITYQNIH